MFDNAATAACNDDEGCNGDRDECSAAIAANASSRNGYLITQLEILLSALDRELCESAID